MVVIVRKARIASESLAAMLDLACPEEFESSSCLFDECFFKDNFDANLRSVAIL